MWFAGDVVYGKWQPPRHIGYAHFPVTFTLLCAKPALLGAAFFSAGAALWTILIHRFLVLGRAYFVGDYRLPTFLTRACFVVLMLYACAFVVSLALLVGVFIAIKPWA